LSLHESAIVTSSMMESSSSTTFRVGCLRGSLRGFDPATR